MKTRNLALCALFAALTALCAWICVPMGAMTFTMQSFAIFLALLMLGGKWGSVAVFVYFMLGCVGLPVFSGFQGGIGTLFGVTGGYLWGFLLCCLSYWCITAIFGTKSSVKLTALAFGQLLCYGCGAGWMLWAHLREQNPVSIGALLLTFVLPYLLPDAAKLWLAWYLSRRLPKA